MKTYIFTIEDVKNRIEFNKKIYVYRMKNNVPLFIGYSVFNSSLSKGNVAEAHNILINIEGYKSKNGVYIDKKDIQVFKV